MREINLTMRYPKSRLEDVTDAFMRGFEVGMAMKKSENEKLRELLSELYESAWLEYPSAFEHTYAERLRELGVEVYGLEDSNC